jgi:hypothetical protein
MSSKTPASAHSIGCARGVGNGNSDAEGSLRGEFLLRLFRRALQHFNGDFPSSHKRCGASRASHKRDAVLADDHLRLLHAHHGPIRNGEFIGNLRPIPIIQAELCEKILDGDPSSSCLVSGAASHGLKKVASSET